MLKIFKFCTGSSAKSYECKFAVDSTFKNKAPDDVKLGNAVKEAMQHKWLRGKFEGVKEELKDLGVTEITLGEESVSFEGTADRIFTFVSELTVGSNNTHQILQALKLSVQK